MKQSLIGGLKINIGNILAERKFFKHKSLLTQQSLYILEIVLAKQEQNNY